MPAIKEYLSIEGRSPFGRWFEGLPVAAALKVTTAVRRLEQGNESGIKGVGAGVLERKIDWGPGLRIYFGRDGDRVIILLGGGDKSEQDRDIADAIRCWQDYKRRRP